MIKKLTASFMAIILMLSMSIVTFAEINRQYITDMLFEYQWESPVEGWYYHYTKSTVKIEHNPIAAMYYMTLEAFVSDCDDERLQRIEDGKENLSSAVVSCFSDWDYTVIKKQNSYYGDSLMYGVEISIADYQYGIWEFVDKDDNTIYGRFIEDETTFTLIDNDTEEVLGVYNKLIGYDYLDDSGYDAGRTSSGGSGSADGSTSGSSNDTSSNNSDSTYITTSDPNIKPNVRESSSTISSITPNVGGYTSVYDTDNPAVTPEIASAVDAAKSANNNDDTGVEVGGTSVEKTTQEENNTGRNILILLIALLAIAAVAFYLVKNKKGDNNGNNNNLL